jgi:hypothetical protein
MVKWQVSSNSLENTFYAVHFYSDSNSNLIMGQFIDVLKASIISGLPFRGLCDTIRKVDGTVLLDNLLIHSLPREHDTSLLNPSKSCDKRTQMMSLTVSVLWSKCNKKYVLVT